MPENKLIEYLRTLTTEQLDKIVKALPKIEKELLK